ncbi:MAG: hypothetical protein JSR37_09570 [Verrucomicrobia bacterium]|nr:hypothetical protein [Verrucomicrobiota bacterium]MBS0637113.1 hypothetical protein [Verrucomicrobiota bacterium]
MISRFEHIIIDPIGVVVSPFAGIVATPILLLGTIYKTIEAWYHGRNVSNECLNLDIAKYETNLTDRDISWLKSEKSRLQALDDANDCKEFAKMTALLVIPLFGYISVFYGDAFKSTSKSNSGKISWITWHLNLLEGRMSKDSLSYKLGWNLPN